MWVSNTPNFVCNLHLYTPAHAFFPCRNEWLWRWFCSTRCKGQHTWASIISAEDDPCPAYKHVWNNHAVTLFWFAALVAIIEYDTLGRSTFLNKVGPSYMRESNLLLAQRIRSSSDLKSTRNWSKSTLHYGMDQLLAETIWKPTTISRKADTCFF